MLLVAFSQEDHLRANPSVRFVVVQSIRTSALASDMNHPSWQALMQAAGRLTRASNDLCGRANGFPGSAMVLRLGCLSEKKVMTASSCGYSLSADCCDPASKMQAALMRRVRPV